MEIEHVELIYNTEEQTDIPNFVIHYKDTKQTTAFVVTATLNRHYQDVKAWYLAQKNKPFEFEFEGEL